MTLAAYPVLDVPVHRHPPIADGADAADNHRLSTALVPAVAQPLSMAEAVERTKEYARAARSGATRRAYASDLRDFEAFCRPRALASLPAEPQTIALYLTDLAGRVKVSTIRRRLVAIAGEHKRHGFEPAPTANRIVREVLRGITNTEGSATRRKDALTVDLMRQALLAVRGDGLKAKRDRAIVLLGFAGALRRSELAALDVADLRFEKRGLLVTIRRSKSDQAGEGHEIAIPVVPVESMCAVRAAKSWIKAAKLDDGPLFRSFSLAHEMTDGRIDGRDVANLVHLLVRRSGLEGDFGGHSLRAGFVTAAAQAGVPLDNIMRTTRHKSLPILMGYVRRANAFDDPALSRVIG